MGMGVVKYLKAEQKGMKMLRNVRTEAARAMLWLEEMLHCWTKNEQCSGSFGTMSTTVAKVMTDHCLN